MTANAAEKHSISLDITVLGDSDKLHSDMVRSVGPHILKAVGGLGDRAASPPVYAKTSIPIGIPKNNTLPLRKAINLIAPSPSRGGRGEGLNYVTL